LIPRMGFDQRTFGEAGCVRWLGGLAGQ
jgi:hypothetical protein